jgi:hypothetical protein
LRRLVNDCIFAELQSEERVSIVLSTWFSVLLVKNGEDCDKCVSVNVSRKAAILLLQLIKPSSSTLAFLTEKYVTEMVAEHKCKF